MNKDTNEKKINTNESNADTLNDEELDMVSGGKVGGDTTTTTFKINPSSDPNKGIRA